MQLTVTLNYPFLHTDTVVDWATPESVERYPHQGATCTHKDSNFTHIKLENLANPIDVMALVLQLWDYQQDFGNDLTQGVVSLAHAELKDHKKVYTRLRDFVVFETTRALNGGVL